jgi:glutathione S-transferase
MVQRGKEMATIFFNRVEPLLAGRDYITLDRFTVADSSGCFTVRLTQPLEMDLSGWSNIAAWFTRINARPSLQL